MGPSNLVTGFLFGILSGILSGSSSVPVKKIKNWHWQNTWLVYSVWTLLIFPLLLAVATVPRLFDVYACSPLYLLLTVVFCGMAWGFSNIGSGLSIRYLGIALTSTIVIGIGNVLGSILPLLITNPAGFFGPVGMIMTVSILIMLAGLILYFFACAEREKCLRKNEVSISAPSAKYYAIAVLTGICSAMFNIALLFGRQLNGVAEKFGASEQNAVNASWLLALFGGFIVTCVYCVSAIGKNRGFGEYARRDTRPNWIMTFLMGLLWFSGVVFYGISVVDFGRYGNSIGWPIFQSMQIIAANIWGVITGEWRGACAKAKRLGILGLFLLICGIAVLGFSGIG